MTLQSSFKTEDQAQQTVDGFVNFISEVGMNPGQPQNTFSAGRYVFNLWTRNRPQLEAAYRGSWVIGQIIDAFAEDMTRAGVQISTHEGAEHIAEMQAAISRYQINQSLCNLVKWGRLYGGAIGVIQIEGQRLDTPLDVRTVGQGQFKGIGVYDRWQLNPDLTRLIMSGPDIGLPEYYNIVLGWDINSANAPTPTGQVTVHHSRCIRMTGIDLPFWQAITEMMWGESVVERVFDRLAAFDDTTLSIANLVDRAQLRTVRVENLREIIAIGGKAYQALLEMFKLVKEFQTNEGLTLLDKNDEFQTTSYSFAGLSDVLLQMGQQIAGASGIPLVRLFGQSPAGLNSTGESDIRMYYDNINAQQEARLRNGYEKILKILYQSEFGIPAPKDLQFKFTPLWQMSQMDQATINKTNAETVIAAHAEGLIDTPTAMQELKAFSEDSGIFSNITDEQIEEAKLEPPMTDMPPGPNESLPVATAQQQQPEKEINQDQNFESIGNPPHSPHEDPKTKVTLTQKIKSWVLGKNNLDPEVNVSDKTK